MCAHTHIYTHTLGSECTKVSSSVKTFLCSSTPISPLPWWAGPPSPNALSPPPSWNGYCLGSAFSISNVKSHFSPFLLDIPPPPHASDTTSFVPCSPRAFRVVWPCPSSHSLQTLPTLPLDLLGSPSLYRPFSHPPWDPNPWLWFLPSPTSS